VCAVKTYLGVELGSTRIKAVLINEQNAPIAAGSHDWENHLENGIWTYHLEDVWAGLQDCCGKTADDYQNKHGERLTRVNGLGISAMMHGYLALDKDGNPLVPFRTWRNTITGQAACLLSKEFGFHIPQRWTIAHLYQAFLNHEPHIGSIAYLTTLSGFVHWKLTGQKVVGIGDASGMFPINSVTGDYRIDMMERFAELTNIELRFILPRVLKAGEAAGVLTSDGVKRLNITGALCQGIPLCPPEGDAGSGMVATHSVARNTGNVSAGTSAFAMTVLDKELSKAYTGIDMIATPTGKPVAMIQSNNCMTDVDAWVGLFQEIITAIGVKPDKSALFEMLYEKALEGDLDGGGLLSYNYFAGEHLTGFTAGRPLFVRQPNSRLTLANFMRVQLYAAMSTLKLGMDLLMEQEDIKPERLIGHGGLFKSGCAGQKLMASALNIPIAVMESAGEGGAWGIALLASFAAQTSVQSLEQFLDDVFAQGAISCIDPDPQSVEGFQMYMKRYIEGLPIERAAVEHYH